LQGKYEDSIKECTKALELKATYTKALVRRAEAYEKLDHLEEAIAGMCGCLRFYPYVLLIVNSVIYVYIFVMPFLLKKNHSSPFLISSCESIKFPCDTYFYTSCRHEKGC